MSEREDLIAALAAEYADVLQRKAAWCRGRCPEEDMVRAEWALGAERALYKVALRLGLAPDELGERAAQEPAVWAENSSSPEAAGKEEG